MLHILRTLNLVVLVLSLTIQCVSAVETESFAITNIQLFDGHNFYQNKSVIVIDGQIAAITDNTAAWPDIRLVEGQGGTLLPGLIDAHAHTKSVEQLTEALRFGVTTVLDMTTPPAVMATLKHAAASRNDVAGFRSAGYLATVPGGHGTQYGGNVPTVSTAAEAAAFIEARVNEGSDYLKIIVSGARSKTGTPTLDGATIKALVEAAHARDLVAMAHIETLADVHTVAEAGIDGLAHIWRDQGANKEVSRMLAEQDIFVISTLAVFDGFVDTAGGSSLIADPRLRPFLSDFALEELATRTYGPKYQDIDRFIAAVAGLVDADVTLLTGSDVRNGTTSYGVSVHRELELLVQAGLSPQQALTAATANVADAFGLEDRGIVAAGRRADLLLVRGDPGKDITASRDIVTIWRNGVAFDRSVHDEE
jgi:imidazolonepropionase-like amidohydrolase